MKKLNKRQDSSSNSSGFTILELVIVIVIIGILAAVTITTYIGTVPSARDVSLQSDLSNASDQLVIDQAQASDHKFPIDLAHASATIKFSGGTTNTYVVDNTDTPKTFCLTATNNNQSYFITQEGKPLPGPCPVLYLDTGIQTSYPGTGTTWTDLSGNGNNGTLNGTTYSSANGGSLSFNGTSDYINAVNSASLNISNTLTIVAWVNFNSIDYVGVTGNLIGITGKGNPDTASGTPSRGWVFMYDNRNRATSFNYTCFGNTNGGWGGGSNNFSSISVSPTIQNNIWYQIAFTVNQTEARLYLNGSQQGATRAISNLSLSEPADDVSIGRALSYYYFKGLMSNIKIYNTTLSADDIYKSFTVLRTRFGV